MCYTDFVPVRLNNESVWVNACVCMRERLGGGGGGGVRGQALEIKLFVRVPQVKLFQRELLTFFLIEFMLNLFCI